MRALLIVLDSVGCGAAPDAAAYGDCGADTLGHLFERELLSNDHDYSGWDLSLSDLERLGVHGIKVTGDEAWQPLPARENLLVYRIQLDRLPGFSPRIP